MALYGSTVDGVDRTGLGSAAEPPAGASLDQVLEPGDLLYIPRGCYHVAVPMNEAALHLTVGVKNPRGLDLLLWIVNRLRTTKWPTASCRSSHRPPNGSATRRSCDVRCWMACPRIWWNSTSARPAAIPRRGPPFNLPWSATPEGLPAGNGFLVRLKGRSHIVEAGGQVGVSRVEVRRPPMQVPRKHAVDHRAAEQNGLRCRSPT